MARESEVVEKRPAPPEPVLSVAHANCLVVTFQTSFSNVPEHEVRPAPVMVEAMLKVVVVAFVALSVVAKNVVEVALVVVPLVPKKLVMTPFVALNVVAKSVVEVELVVVLLRPVKFCKVVEAKVMSPPQNCDAVVDVATR